METKFAETMSNEASRLDRDVKAADDKSLAVQEERKRLRAEEWAAICRSREQQLKLKKERAMRTKASEQQFVAAWKVRALQQCFCFQNQT